MVAFKISPFLKTFHTRIQNIFAGAKEGGGVQKLIEFAGDGRGLLEAYFE